MKSPDDIKKGLAVCATLDGDCENCPYDDGKQLACVDRSRRDALAYIQLLEGSLEMWKAVAPSPGAVEDMVIEINRLTERLAQVKRERDAVEERIHGECSVCANGKATTCNDCIHNEWAWHPKHDYWKLNGVCEENTKDDSGAHSQ